MKKEIKIGDVKLKWWRWKHIKAATNCKVDVGRRHVQSCHFES
jgi:hypothetical protein